ncbi:TRAP transporter small permease [Lachnoclostridium pacaense]|uniref:TRAP transporter small permease n=1 Tax=Enterocloster hominis (ex Hitch et al. 2024) TaxID=1917870 RepID=UPI001D11CC8A|nr:TRAP transporter small permease [Lachnoclostridium pacaense]MCC2816145.1 TRAP transporter small permease [Lachnoclostridium pacaense]
MKRLISGLHKLEEYSLILSLAVMGIVLFVQIIMRTFFSAPLKWAEELARYLQIWITFLGIGYGIRRGSHIGMTLLKDRLPPVLKALCGLIVDVAGFLAFIVLFRTSLQFLAHQNVVSTAMELPMQLVYLVIPVGAVIYMAYDMGMIVSDIRKILQRRKDGC